MLLRFVSAFCVYIARAHTRTHLQILAPPHTRGKFMADGGVA
uniref:Uncharacterized protein n=1 Tax=Anopheles dirus TaxID=7168 RepID=A0A182NWC4_9DIPT